ncbi:head-tail adaptor protein [Primorskyibacter sp. S87]|uniref:head-tail adaptor protein n=1 Tax=Primorskyibacter sp. S87 TaxID=3415126 RepID=UPI003C7B9511
MRKPHLTRRLELEAPERVADGAGGFSESWIALGQLWADLQPRSGRARSEAGIPISSTGFRVLVRAAPAGSTMRPGPGQRFRDGGRVFMIRAVTEFDPAGRFLLCFSDEEIAA